MSGRPVLIMAGGTGGHVFPALAVAQELLAARVPVVWLGTRRGLEARVVPEHDIPVAWVRVSGLRGKGLVKLLLAPLMLGLALVQSLVAILRLRPRAVLGMGGFVAGPGGLVAWLLRRPLVIHEQNAVAGFTNRCLAPLASRVLEAFPGSLPARCHPVHTGNPVRRAITGVPAPEQRLAGRAGAPRLLVLGGSLGARALNQVVPAALRQMDPARRPEVWHQAGRALLDETRGLYAQTGIGVRLAPFIEDMAEAYAWADLVLCRAGALTVAELSVTGLGAVLVPYPHAVDDHQSANARYLVDAGAALLVPQHELSPAGLAGLLNDLLADRGRLLEMAVAARRLGRPDAAEVVAGHCLQVARG